MQFTHHEFIRLQCINRDNDTLRKLVENIEIEQGCLKELLRAEPHWMGSVNGTQRKLMHCGMNLETMLFKLRQQGSDPLDVVPELDPTRSRATSKGSSHSAHSSGTKSKSTSGEKMVEVESLLRCVACIVRANKNHEIVCVSRNLRRRSERSRN